MREWWVGKFGRMTPTKLRKALLPPSEASDVASLSPRNHRPLMTSGDCQLQIKTPHSPQVGLVLRKNTYYYHHCLFLEGPSGAEWMQRKLGVGGSCWNGAEWRKFPLQQPSAAFSLPLASLLICINSLYALETWGWGRANGLGVNYCKEGETIEEKGDFSTLSQLRYMSLIYLVFFSLYLCQIFFVQWVFSSYNFPYLCPCWFDSFSQCPMMWEPLTVSIIKLCTQWML